MRICNPPLLLELLEYPKDIKPQRSDEISTSVKAAKAEKIQNHILTLPYSRRYEAEYEKVSIKVLPILEGRKVKYIKIIPIQNAKYFEIQYTYEVAKEQREVDKQKALAIDFGIDNLIYVKEEESYTSKASFLDGDEIPVYNADNPQKYEFSGKRVKRGLYRSARGIEINADVNGAANILRKSKVVPLEGLYCRGKLSVPLRIRVYSPSRPDCNTHRDIGT